MGEKQFDPTEKWLERGMRFCFLKMADLKSPSSETHESAIKICFLVIMTWTFYCYHHHFSPL
jgi:hypothetical protein